MTENPCSQLPNSHPQLKTSHICALFVHSKKAKLESYHHISTYFGLKIIIDSLTGILTCYFTNAGMRDLHTSSKVKSSTCTTHISGDNLLNQLSHNCFTNLLMSKGASSKQERVIIAEARLLSLGTFIIMDCFHYCMPYFLALTFFGGEELSVNTI